MAVALADMHECRMIKKDVKRFRGKFDPQIPCKQRFHDQPRSAFCFFMESYASTHPGEDLIEINREGFEKWRNMSKEGREPYIGQADKVNSAYLRTLLQEVDVPRADDGADSAWVGKYDQRYEDSDSLHSYSYKEDESFDTYSLKMMWPWGDCVHRGTFH
ncbi:hypothetical protein Dimus_022557 [Dionaea muscipula]